MDKNVHHIDELFHSALEDYEAMPSEAYNSRMDATLDEKKTSEQKKKFFAGIRPAMILVLLIASLAISESSLIKMGSGNYISNEGKGPEKITHQTTNTKKMKDFSTEESTGKENTLSHNETISFLIKQNKINTTTFSSTIKKPFAKNITETTSTPFPEKENSQYKKIAKNFTAIKLEEGKFLKPFSFNILQNPLPVVSFKPVFSTQTSGNQNETSAKKKKHVRSLWILSPFISYDQAGYMLDSDAPSTITSIKFSEVHEPSFSGGLLLSRNVVKGFHLQSGLLFRRTAIGMKPQKVYAFSDPTGNVAFKYITSSGYAYIKPNFGGAPVVGDSLTTAEGKHILENVSLPLLLNYTVAHKRFSITPAAGIEASFITKANLEVDIEDPFNKEIVQVNRLNGVKTLYWSFVAGGEIGYRLNGKLSVTLRPVYRVAITPITKNNVVETFPKSFGIGAGLNIRL